ADGFRFSVSTTRRDWTDEILTEIRQTYSRYVDPRGATRVNLQGLDWETNKGGRLPIERYLAELLAAREDLAGGRKTSQAVADQTGLNAKYLASLWAVLNGSEPSQLLDTLRARWRTAGPGDVAAMTASINAWQQALTKFQSVGHMKSW